MCEELLRTKKVCVNITYLQKLYLQHGLDGYVAIMINKKITIFENIHTYIRTES